jgi:hypothetical protein
MRLWIYAAVCLLLFGTLFPILHGDGAGAAEGMIRGGGALIVVLLVSGLIWLVKLLFKSIRKS